MRSMKCVLLFCCTLLSFSPIVEAQERLYGLDVRTSQIVRFDAASGETQALFSTPVLCRPEGACGLAFSGYSLFFIDATDPENQIFELNPQDGTIWNNLTAPAADIDGLAFDAGILYATSFSEDRIYKLDPVRGEVLDALDVHADLIGGLAAGGGRLFGGNVRPGQIFEIDIADGRVLQTLAAPGEVPVGLALFDGHLFVSDLERQELLKVDPDGGALVQAFTPAANRMAALAAGVIAATHPYELRLEVVREDLEADGSVVYDLRTGLYDGEGNLVATNNRSTIKHVLSEDLGQFLDGPDKTLENGQTSVILKLPIGVRVQLEARLSGLDAPKLALGAISPAARLEVSLRADAEDPSLIGVTAALFDRFGTPASSDTQAVSFRMAYGGGVLIGPDQVLPEEGVATTWVRLVRQKTEVVVEAHVAELQEKGRLEVGHSERPIASRGGLTISGQRAAGRDETPPAAPAQVRAALVGGRAQISWELSADEGTDRWIPYNGYMSLRTAVSGYRIFRSKDGGLFEEVDQVDAGVDRSVVDLDGAGTYRFKVLAEESENLGESPIAAGSEADQRRTVVFGASVGLDAEGNTVSGLFDDDLLVGFSDFFLFAERFGQRGADEAFDSRFDLDGDGSVGFGDFFIFADNFGKEAVSR